MLTHRTVGSVMTREVVRVAPATGFRDIVAEVLGHAEGVSPAAVGAEVTHGRAVTAGTSGHRSKEVRHGNHP